MEYHQKLSVEAYANDHVIHQNACADRKLQKQLDHLEKMQKRQRKRFEQEEHYFQALHRVVPSMHPGDDLHTQTRGQGRGARHVLSKRLTYPTMSPHSYVVPALSCSDGLDNHCTPNAHRDILKLKGIASDAPHGYQTSKSFESVESKSVFDRNHSVVTHQKHPREHEPALDKPEVHHENIRTRRTAWLRSSEADQRFLIKGTESHLSERGPITPRHSTDIRVLSSNVKCSQFVRDNRKYLKDIIIESASSTSASTEGSNEEQKGRSERQKNSTYSDQSEWDSTSDVEERLPNIAGEKVGLRVLTAEKPSFEMRMLYQMKNGHLEVPKVDTEKNTKFQFAIGDEVTRIEKLSFGKGKLRKASSLEDRYPSPQQASNHEHSDLPSVSGTHMTLVKFLPKSKQALYLKYGSDSVEGLSNSWHAGEINRF